MSVPCKFERSILSHDEYETIRLTHHPTIYEVEPAELEAIRSRLRKMRDKERTLSRQKRREARGKSGGRGASFPGTAERPSQRNTSKRLDRLSRYIELRTLFLTPLPELPRAKAWSPFEHAPKNDH